MCELSGDVVVLGQHEGGDVQLRVFGDEFYARYETLDGYTAIYDTLVGRYCYALLAAGRLTSSGVPITKPVPAGIPRHLKEDPSVRNEIFERRYERLRPREVDFGLSAERTLGPDDGLLEGRKIHEGTVVGLTLIIAHLALLFWEMRYVSASLAHPGLKPSPRLGIHEPAPNEPQGAA